MLLLGLMIICELIFSINSEVKDFGEFRVELEGVDNPLPKNDVVDSRFMISKTNKFEKQLTARIEVHRRLVDIKVQTEICKKGKKANSAEYQILYPMSFPRSFCSKLTEIYPVFQKSLEPKIDEKDCGLAEGNHTLHSYSVEEELRNHVGNKTFYGGYKVKVIIVEGQQTNPVFGYQIYYTVKEANSTTTTTTNSKKSNKQNKNRKQ